MDTLAKIEILLEEKGISDIEFCEKMGLYSSALSEWRNGKTKSFKKHIDKIAAIFNVSTDYLLGAESPREVISNDDLKFALWGDVNITDDLLDEVKRLAKLHKMLRDEDEKASQKD